MCIFTHFAAGALAGGLTGNIYVGAAAGLASHAVLDVIPHYDHPDWRLELAGGVVSLVLLMLMPFVSWPAIIGGVFGLVPDIENLLQKLGKMRRDQFVYPTHTGLLPHGRSLGPKSLVWQFAIFTACFVLLGLFSPGTARAAVAQRTAVMASPVVQVLVTEPGRTVVRVEFPVLVQPDDWQTADPMKVQWALPLFVADDLSEGRAAGSESAPQMGLSLAVPTRQSVTWTTRNVQWWKQPGSPATMADLLDFSAPVVARSVPLTGTAIPLAPWGGILRSLTIEVNHPVSGEMRNYLQLAGATNAQDQLNWQGRVRAGNVDQPGVVNPELFARLAEGSRQVALARSARLEKSGEITGYFGLTRNWVRLNLTQSGLYQVTGQDLSGYGVAVANVDPAKLRVFRGGGLPLAMDPETPDSLQIDRIGLNEVAIEVVAGGDGEWNLDDEIRFYGVGTSAWLDRLDPAGQRLEYFEHPYAAEATYWVTWEDELTVSPLPGAPRRVVPTAAQPTGGTLQQTARVRLHREEQFVDVAGLVADNWLWDNSIFGSRAEEFSLPAPVPGLPVMFQVDVRGIYSQFSQFDFEAAAYLNADSANQATVGISFVDQSDSLRVRLVGESTSGVAGTNTLTLRNISTDRPLRPLGLDSFDILYWTPLDLSLFSGQLEFGHWGDQVTTVGTSVDLEIAPMGAGTINLWDVSDPATPRILQGAAGAAGTTEFGLVRDPDSNRHFVAAMDGSLLAVDRGSRAFPVSLRSQSVDVDYLVVSAQAFATAAGDLAQYHSQFLPGVTSPAARVASVEDIYDNFAGGQKDILAIRNYLKWVYESGAHRLKYVCFLGNASRDYRNYGNRRPLIDLYDMASSELRTRFPKNPTALSIELAYSSDDGLVSFDAVPAGDFDFPDLACGRLPALDRNEAQGMVDRAIAYDRDSVPGLWRNRILMTADDGVRPSSFPDARANEFIHGWKAEDISNNFIPLSVDVTKVFAADYDFPPGSAVKPGVRAAINTALNSGTSIFYYVGHGSEDNLADEQIFQSRDIPNLTNGLRRPIFMAFSCDVGVFDSPSRRSMAEQFLQYETGGAIGAICAAQVSFISYNNFLTDAFFRHLFPAGHIDDRMAVAEALRLAKSDMTPRWQFRTNSQRYNFFGDPGMVLPLPVDDLALAPVSVDTLRTGALQSVVLQAAGKVLLGAGDVYSLRVEESAAPRRIPFNVIRNGLGEIISVQDSSYLKPGASIFIGTGTVGAGDHAVRFKVPVQFQYGDKARVRLIVETPDGDHDVAERIPAVRAAVAPNDDVLGPDIGLSFEGGQYRVQPGARLTGAVADTSGVAILGTSPGNSLLLEFDNSGFMTDITTAFSYDADSYTAGRLSFPLPRDLPGGRHLAALHASDVLGNVGSDTLSFEIGEAGQGTINSVTLFPNPTPGYCRLLFELGDPMEVQWDIYSLAGSRLRSIRAKLGAGPQVLEWDGFDGRNDEIANGTYLYVLRGLGAGADGREIRKTGKLVIMR